MEVTVNGKVCGILPKRTGVSKNGNEWVSQYIVIAINDDEENKFAFQVFGRERIESLSLYNGMRIAVTLDFTQAKNNDNVFYTNVFAKNIYIIPKKNFNNNDNNNNIEDII